MHSISHVLVVRQLSTLLPQTTKQRPKSTNLNAHGRMIDQTHTVTLLPDLFSDWLRNENYSLQYHMISYQIIYYRIILYHIMNKKSKSQYEHHHLKRQNNFPRGLSNASPAKARRTKSESPSSPPENISVNTSEVSSFCCLIKHDADRQFYVTRTRLNNKI